VEDECFHDVLLFLSVFRAGSARYWGWRWTMTRPVISKGVMPTRLRRAPPAQGSRSSRATARRSAGFFDQAGVTADEHAPPLAHRLVNVIDFEGHDTGDLAAMASEVRKTTTAVGEDEIDREGLRTELRWTRRCARSAGREVVLALLQS
jgi:hypothetical protein